MELRTIAVIDDDATTRKVLQWILERQGYTVVAVANADEALAVCSEPKLAVAPLIVDVRLRSEATGIDIAVAVRERFGDVPVLVTSGTPPEGWTERDFAGFKTLLGNADFIPKPFTASALVEKLTGLLNGTSAESALRLYNSAELHRSGLIARANKKV
ncbi:MAG TPA: response regulator [Candidatus Limnocylindrales bacterium]|nr:response regulator [Candidatus Limnocylindrales bacterium]